MSGRTEGWAIAVVLASSLAGQVAAQGSAPAGDRDRDRAVFRASLTATVLMAGPAADSAGTACRVVSVEWRALAGSGAYQVQVSAGSPDLWIAVSPDPRCPGGGAAGANAYHDRVPRPPLGAPAVRRAYRVVATAKDGPGLDVTTPVSVEIR